MADRTRGILLDSSVIIAHLRGKIDLFQFVAADEPLFMPLVALGELWKGALKSADPAKNNARIESILRVVSVLDPDSATALHYARASVALEAKGRPIPENDLWIAAVALELDMPLATSDAHFDRIDGLTILKW
ncbi:PIN domain-containing protein [Luteolibacter flavescens]|uniref:Ribonuclease VapC n=1 Tax=Luteolibacter flavescens TaxID=1859460 RepID=A0ABT3FWL4_9BACT|nr:PIN domain-containing protein [Luteolibacter flavescens]MCW1887797.1 PIN domain-containing protein [Luteolibacter flavescens]